VRPSMVQTQQLTGGLTMFLFQYLVQAGVFFVVPLFLSVALGSPRSPRVRAFYPSPSRCC
jgi:hypothetical protein